MAVLKPTVVKAEILQALLDNAKNGITIAEREGDDTVLLYVNAAFEQLTGYTEEECLYKDCRFLQANDHQQTAREQIRQAIENAQACQVTLRNYRKDGSLFWNELTITPFRDPEEGITYYIGIQQDVTALMLQREELEDAQKRIAELEAEKQCLVKALQEQTKYVCAVECHTRNPNIPKGIQIA